MNNEFLDLADNRKYFECLKARMRRWLSSQDRKNKRVDRIKVHPKDFYFLSCLGVTEFEGLPVVTFKQYDPESYRYEFGVRTLLPFG